MISMVEVLIAYFIEERGFSRRNAVIFNSLIIALFSLLVNFGMQNRPFFSSVNFWLLGRNVKGFMDIFDFISSDILLPIGGLLIAILVGWFTNKKDIHDELSNHGTLNNSKIISIYLTILKIVTPVLLVILFLNVFGVFHYVTGN
jgi:NSS family neurotransmitter:Na+ symporter